MAPPWCWTTKVLPATARRRTSRRHPATAGPARPRRAPGARPRRSPRARARAAWRRSSGARRKRARRTGRGARARNAPLPAALPAVRRPWTESSHRAPRYRERPMQLVDQRPNVELPRGTEGDPIVVLAFPYDPHIVAVARGIPQRRFDWDRRERFAPVDDWAGVHVADVLARFPELTTSAEVDAWLAGIERRWVGRVTTARHDGRGWWALSTRAGTVPAALRDGAVHPV